MVRTVGQVVRGLRGVRENQATNLVRCVATECVPTRGLTETRLGTGEWVRTCGEEIKSMGGILINYEIVF